MAGKTVTDKAQDPAKKPAATKPAAKPAAAKPGPKARGTAADQPGSGGKDIPKTGMEHLANDDHGTFVVEVPDVDKVFLENMAHALIFDIFQMKSVLHAIARCDEAELIYFLDTYASRLRTLLQDDRKTGHIDALLDVGVWQSLEGQEQRLTELLVERLAGDILTTPEQLKELLIEATYGARREERPSRGERWMPARHRNSSTEDVARCSPRRQLSDNAHSRRS